MMSIKNLGKTVVNVPYVLDEQVARFKLESLGTSIDCIDRRAEDVPGQLGGALRFRDFFERAFKSFLKALERGGRAFQTTIRVDWRAFFFSQRLRVERIRYWLQMGE